MVSSSPRPHFTPGKDPVNIVQGAGWSPGPVWTGGKSRPHRDSIPDRPARSSVAIPTELPGPRLRMGYVQTPIVLQIKEVSLILCEFEDREELHRQPVGQGEVLSLRSIELCPYTVELSVLVCTRTPICLFQNHLNRKVNSISRPCI